MIYNRSDRSATDPTKPRIGSHKLNLRSPSLEGIGVRLGGTPGGSVQ
jgi:hypothetical protein